MTLGAGKLFILSGPSGVGKKVIVDHLLRREHLNLVLSVSYTTRPRRFNEEHGVDYFFIGQGEFEERINSGEMLEYARHFDNYYGTSRSHVEEHMSRGKNVLLEIDTMGFKQVIGKVENVVSIFIMPPSLEVLEQRLIRRGTESPERIKDRMDKARIEMRESELFKHIIVNDILDRTLQEVEDLFLKEMGGC